MHESAFQDAVVFRDKYLDVSKLLKIADIGSYDVNGTLKPIFANQNWEYIGLDIMEGPNVDVVIPTPYGWSSDYENNFDVVLSTQVVEHVRKPWEWIKDLVTACKPGGIIYVCTPNTLGFHEYPIDCWRIWADGMRGLMDSPQLRIVDCYHKDIDTTGVAIKLF